MAEIIKKHKEIALVGGLGLILTIVGIIGMSGMVALPNTVSAATTVQQSVGVTATVNEWLTFTVSPSSVTLTPDLVDAAGGTHIASSSVVSLNLGTNSADGWSIDTTSTNGALKSGTNTINSAAAGNTTTTSPGTDAYGMNATSVASGVNIDSIYDHYGTHTMGSIAQSSQELATSSSTFADGTNVIDLKIEASCDALQPAGSYSDTIYLTATATP